VEIVVAASAIKILRRMRPKKAQDILVAIERVAADPRAKYNNLKPLKGIRNGFRIGVGDWRVSFTLDYAADIMDVFEIAARGDAYR
jgi:mRNA interferase RelE/StbE